jgi:hypothetical protein
MIFLRFGDMQLHVNQKCHSTRPVQRRWSHKDTTYHETGNMDVSIPGYYHFEYEANSMSVTVNRNYPSDPPIIGPDSLF